MISGTYGENCDTFEFSRSNGKLYNNMFFVELQIKGFTRRDSKT